MLTLTQTHYTLAVSLRGVCTRSSSVTNSVHMNTDTRATTRALCMSSLVNANATTRTPQNNIYTSSHRLCAAHILLHMLHIFARRLGDSTEKITPIKDTTTPTPTHTRARVRIACASLHNRALSARRGVNLNPLHTPNTVEPTQKRIHFV